MSNSTRGPRVAEVTVRGKNLIIAEDDLVTNEMETSGNERDQESTANQ